MIKNNITALVKLTFFTMSLLTTSSLYALTADNDLQMQVHRYSTVSVAPTAAQINPLLTIVQVTFSGRASTVGDAVNEVLRYSGYGLAPKGQQSSDLITVLSKPLPLVDKQIGPMTVEEELLVLVGKHTFMLESDSINRTVNFKLITPANKITTKRK